QEGMQVIREIVEIFDHYEWDCEVLVASIRQPLHVIEAAKLGADIVTLPFDVLKEMTQHALTDVGLKRFLDDAAKVPKYSSSRSDQIAFPRYSPMGEFDAVRGTLHIANAVW